MPESRQGKLKLSGLIMRSGEKPNLRELIVGDYLLLYAVRQDNIYLLSVKHHLQLSFDLAGHWAP